jgi:phage I-like protein
MVNALHRVLLSVDLGANEAPPTEFRLFKAGANPTTKGVFLFDEAAAAAVMKAYREQGVDLIMDLEHLSLDSKAPHYDPDARAHYELEVRAGELWAVNVRWTSDGRRRLAEKTQRYPSPAFLADEEGRISEIVNTALVSMPATHGAPALVAAAKRGLAPPTRLGNTGGSGPQATRLSNMNPELLKKILAAIEAGDDKSGLLAEIVAQAAGGAPAPEAASDALSDTAATPPAEEPKPELSALTARLTKLEAEKADSVKKLSARIAELEAEKASEDQAERVKLCGELVKLGAETPASAWEGEPEKLKPCKRLQAVAIADMREHVKALSARGPIVTAEPPTAGAGEVKLSKSEQEYCTKHSLTPEQFAARKAGSVKKATK